MSKESVQVFEWKIENFSCWCEAVHGKCIESPRFFFTHFKKAELYPRGVSGQDSHSVVQICDVASDFSGDLSFIGSDGSLIHTQQVKRTKEDVKVLGVSLGPSIFDEVVIQKADHKDEVTLRFCIQSDKSYEQQMRTTIDALKISLKIDPLLIEILKTRESVGIFFIPYTSTKEDEGMFIKMVRQSDKVQLKMESPSITGNTVLVESCTYMLSSDGAPVKYEENKHVSIKKEEWTFSESLKIEELQENGTTLLLRFKIINGVVIQGYNHLNYHPKETSMVPYNTSIGFSDLKSSSPASSNQSVDSVTVLTKELMCLYQDQDFSDFQLKCGDISFPVHKNILSARSPVFKTMLSCDMREAAYGCMDIVDLDAPTLGLFLTYLYTGAVDDLQCDRALKLYYAADKYQVPTLKKECADFLCDNISIENVCASLTLGNKHNDDDLTVVSRNFVLNNYSELLGSKVWENFMEDEPMLALKTLTYFGKKNFLGKTHIP